MRIDTFIALRVEANVSLQWRCPASPRGKGGDTFVTLYEKRRGRPAGAKAKSKPTVPPKYRDPKTGKTWSGRGRAPAWLGKNPNRFLIAEE